MRADDSKSAREVQNAKLSEFLGGLVVGFEIPIADWYQFMRELGLEHSDTQRVSDLRKQGLIMPFSKKDKSYRYLGWGSPEVAQQLDLTLGDKHG